MEGLDNKNDDELPKMNLNKTEVVNDTLIIRFLFYRSKKKKEKKKKRGRARLYTIKPQPTNSRVIIATIVVESFRSTREKGHLTLKNRT